MWGFSYTILENTFLKLMLFNLRSSPYCVCILPVKLIEIFRFVVMKSLMILNRNYFLKISENVSFENISQIIGDF
jgi:hypothetical protein